MKTFIYGAVAGLALGLALATGAYYVAGGMKKSKVDDWRHLHTWGSWSPCAVSGKMILTRSCSSCNRWQLISAATP
jgi:hypothetical protein